MENRRVMKYLYQVFIVALLLLAQPQKIDAQEKIKVGVLTNGEGSNINWTTSLPEFDVIDASVKSFLVSQQGWELDRRLLQQKPEFCIIYGGLPDILLQLSVKDISEAYKHLCSEMMKSNIKPIIIATLPVSNHVAINSSISQLNRELQSYATQNGIFYYSADKGLAHEGELLPEISDDGFMLNNSGISLFTNNIAAYIDDVIALKENRLVPRSTAHNLTSSAIDNIMKNSHSDIKIVMLGNSLTAGGKNWNARLNRNDTHNAGQGGYTTGQMLWHMDRTVIDVHPKICFVMAGINDLFNNIAPDIIYRNQKQIINKLINNGIKPVILLTLYTHNNPSLAQKIDYINNRIISYCEKENIDVINLNPLLASEQSLKAEYTTDGTHLTEAGYLIWSKELARYLAIKAIK